MSQSFDLPVDVPWQLVAASPDMMDTTFCKGDFPPPWRSSLAIYAYEPSPDDLPSQLCNQKITYLKVSCSITGYQPTLEETNQLSPGPLSLPPNPAPAHVNFLPDGSLDDTTLPFGDFADAYFSCYGVLLNIAVFPSTTTVPSATAGLSTFHFDLDSSYPNPLTSGDLTFTLTPGGAKLPVARLPGETSYGLLIGNAQLQIDLPLSRNISLTITNAKPVRGQSQDGTITAYLGTQAVFTTPLVAGVANITADGNITRVIIQSKGASYLGAITYSDVERPTTIGDYPHIIDFEPKTRDLYQAATDQNELLTGSNTGVSTGKSMSNTSSSEMGLGLSGGYAAGQSGGPNVTGSVTGKWGNTSNDSSSLQIDNSRERRETQGTTTNITQQYNLLTGYHAGTNRAAFLMLPRPHTLQATDYRTFVRGLRMIEGLQDFFLIVSRPTILPGICIEASLETGHFPENVSTQVPPVVVPSGTTTYFSDSASAHASGGFTTSPTLTPFTINLPDPYIVDSTATSPPATYSYSGVPGVFYHCQPIAGQNTNSTEWSQAINSFSLSISQSVGGTVTGEISITGQGAPAEHNADIEVLFKIAQIMAPAVPVDQEQIVVSDFLVTSRELCVCFNSCPSDRCVEIAPPVQVPYSQSPAVNSASSSGNGEAAGVALAVQQDKHGLSARSSIVYETKLKVPRRLLKADQLKQSRTPAARELMHQIQHHLMNSWRMPQRRAHGAVGFLDSDYLAERIRRRLPKKYLSSRITEVKALSPKVASSLGTHATIDDILKLDLHRLSLRAKVDVAQAVGIRRAILGFQQEPNDIPGNEPAKSAGPVRNPPKSRTRRKQ